MGRPVLAALAVAAVVAVLTVAGCGSQAPRTGSVVGVETTQCRGAEACLDAMLFPPVVTLKGLGHTYQVRPSAAALTFGHWTQVFVIRVVSGVYRLGGRFTVGGSFAGSTIRVAPGARVVIHSQQVWPTVGAESAAALCEQYARPIAQGAAVDGTATLYEAYMSDESDVAAWDGQHGTTENGATSEFSGMSPSTPLAVCFFSGTFPNMEPPLPGATAVSPATVVATYIAVVEAGGIARGDSIRLGTVSPPPTIASS